MGFDGLWDVEVWVLGVSMGVEKIFCGVSCGFLFVFWVLLLVLIGVLGSVCGWFGALSMLPKVTFNVVKRDL